MKPWVPEVCSSQPEELQIIGPETYIQRRNITAVEHPEQDGTPAYTDYKCESLSRLYEHGRLTKAGIAARVKKGTITEDDYKTITGEDYKDS